MKKIEGWEKTFEEKFNGSYDLGHYHGDSSLGITQDTQDIESFIRSEIQKAREEVIDQIDPFDLVEPCVPDCTPEQHSYHKGTWMAQIRLEEILAKLKKNL